MFHQGRRGQAPGDQQWIRTGNVYDGVIDFDPGITRDPAQARQTFLAAYDSGDHLHPSDAGYQAMGEGYRPRPLFK